MDNSIFCGSYTMNGRIDNIGVVAMGGCVAKEFRKFGYFGDMLDSEGGAERAVKASVAAV